MFNNILEARPFASSTAILAENLVVVEPIRPNPFRGNTRIAYRLAETAFTRLAIYDVLGREVKVLVQEPQGPGDHFATWDGMNRHAVPAARGVYFYRLTIGSTNLVGRMILSR